MTYRNIELNGFFFFFFRRSINLRNVTLSDGFNISFSGFLHSVNLINCNLTHIGPLTFTKLTGLSFIDISNNQILRLDKACFSGLNQLIWVDLSNNLITSLPQKIFHNVARLSYINLSGNKLTHISAGLFMKLSPVTILDLSQNHLAIPVTDDFGHSNFRPHQPLIIEVPNASFVCVGDIRLVIIGVSTLAGFLVVLVATTLGFYKFRGEIKVMLYYKLGWRPFDQSDDTDILNKVGLNFAFNQTPH